MTLGTGRSRGGTERCFTFIELLIVCAAIGILAMAGMPMIRNGAAQLSRRSCANRISAFCRYLSYEASVSNSPVSLRVDLSGGRLSAFRDQGKKQFGGFSVPRGLTLEADRETVVFAPDGASDGFRIDVSAGGRTSRIAPAGYGRFNVEEI